MKYIMIATLSLLTLTVWAQDAPQSQRTQEQGEVSAIGEEVPSYQEKVEISTTDIPQEVMQHLKESQYGNMRVVSAYEVHTEGGEATLAETQESMAQVEDKTRELETTEETEETGELVAAEAPTTDEEVTEAKKEVYDRVQYQKYSEANSDGYAKVAQSQGEATSDSQYELHLEGDQETATLIYDGTGELIKAAHEDM